VNDGCASRELCEGMSAAGSFDEVIEGHEAYLLSSQLQCFLVPNKPTLCSDGTVSEINARCEKEVDRIKKQFDDCMAFLLRVGYLGM
ncbi:hypothetical protein Tco_0888123, partial [Tanacetum coccineum]